MEPQHRSSPMPRLCTMYTISLHDRRACVPWQGVCVGAHGGACGRSAGHRAYRQPCCYPRRSCPCGAASARPNRQEMVSDTPHLFFGTLLSGGTSASCSGVSLVGSPVFSSAPFDVPALLRRFVVHRHVIPWTRVRIYRCRALLHGLFFRLPMGHWTRANAEICLLAVRGHPKRQAKDVHQVIISHVEEHGKKPDEVRERIERLMGDVPRIELFARQKADGWDVWGNEVINDVELTTQHISP